MYVNRSHMEGYYISEEYIEHEICDQCGDCDDVEFEFNTVEEFIEECKYGGYSTRTILDIIEQIPNNEEYKIGYLRYKEQEFEEVKRACGAC